MMKWAKKDLEQFVKEKEYIDTLFIPLIPIHTSIDEKMTGSGFQAELTNLFSRIIEEQFRGRIVLAPDYYYIAGNAEAEVDRVNNWIDSFTEKPFSYVFLFSFDRNWRKSESDLRGELLWFPGLRHGDLQSTETQSFVKEQAKEIVEIIKESWQT
ncbi:YpiF family protein [Salimicrobium jeotgali]|nr:YpiF family protein [Salimicrobium jeotgali]